MKFAVYALIAAVSAKKKFVDPESPCRKVSSEP